MMFLFFTLAAFAASPSVIPSGLRCESRGAIRIREMGKVQAQPASYCFTPDFSYFISESCRRGRCGAFRASLAGISDKALMGKVGSPGFKLCRLAGGEAELLEFKEGTHWWEMDRCRFPDGSYVDTGLLLQLWGRARGLTL